MARDDQALALWAPQGSSARRAISRIAAVGVAAVAFASIPVLPLAIIGPVALATFLAFLTFEVGGARTSKSLAAWRERGERQAARENALVSAGCGREKLFELERLVASIEHKDPELANRLELQSLLDRHVALAISYQRALNALRMSDYQQLLRIRDELRIDFAHDPRRLEMCERRIESHERVQTKAQALEDELAILDDLIHLVAQRAACPDELPPNDAIEHDLMELDGRDAGARLLAAEIH